jgi:hypothetical protein
MKEIVTKYLWIVCISAVLLSLASCGNMPAADRVIDQNQKEVEGKKTKAAGNFDSMARALGCVFAPQSCKK